MANMFRTIYPQAFEEFRKIYGAVANDPKSIAFKAWEKTSRRRPRQELLLACVVCYLQDLDSDNAKRRGDKRPKCHSATWLNQQRWEGFMELGEKHIANEAAKTAVLSTTKAEIATDLATRFPHQYAAWQMRRGRLARVLNEAEMKTWFENVLFDTSEPPRLLVLKDHLRAAIDRKYLFTLRRVFGADLTVDVIKT